VGIGDVVGILSNREALRGEPVRFQSSLRALCPRVVRPDGCAQSRGRLEPSPCGCRPRPQRRRQNGVGCDCRHDYFPWGAGPRPLTQGQAGPVGGRNACAHSPTRAGSGTTAPSTRVGSSTASMPTAARRRCDEDRREDPDLGGQRPPRAPLHAPRRVLRDGPGRGLRLQFASGLSMDQRPMLWTTQEEAHEEALNRLLVWRVARQIRVDRRFPEGEVVRVTLHDRDGQGLLEPEVSQPCGTPPKSTAESAVRSEPTAGPHA